MKPTLQGSNSPLARQVRPFQGRLTSTGTRVPVALPPAIQFVRCADVCAMPPLSWHSAPGSL